MAVGESASACSSGARAPRHRYRSITRVSATSAGNPRTPADIRRPPLASSNHRGRLRMADYVRRDSFSHARFIRRTREIDRSRSFFRATQTPAAWCPPESITSPREDKKSANHQRDNGSARAAPYCQARRGEPQDTRHELTVKSRDESCPNLQLGLADRHLVRSLPSRAAAVARSKAAGGIWPSMQCPVRPIPS